MFLFGHLGYGAVFSRAFRNRRPLYAVLVGALLPDLIDKPLYYGGFVTSGTRSIAHTLLFYGLVLVAAFISKSQVYKALALGVVTHLIADNLGDVFLHKDLFINARILLWPLLGRDFPELFHLNLHTQFARLATPYVFWTELSGLVFLISVVYLEKRQGLRNS